MRPKLSTVIDTLFTALVTFILSYVLFYYFVPRPFALTFSFVTAGLITLFAFKKLNERKHNFLTSKAQREARDIMANQLCLYTVTEQTDFFQKAFKKAGFLPERKRGYLYFKEKNVCVFCKFGFDSVTKTDIVKVFNTIKRTDTAYILSESFSNEIITFSKRFDGRIKTADKREIFDFLAEHDCLPSQKFILKNSEQKSRPTLKNLFQKKKAKTHLLFGLTFLTMSYFVSIKTYYVICGSIFLILALFCRLFGKEELKNSTT